MTYDRCTKHGKMYSRDDHSHHPWHGPVLRETTEEISESLEGLLYQVFLQLHLWLLTLCHPIMHCWMHQASDCMTL